MIHLTTTTMPVGQRKLTLAVDQIESYETFGHGSVVRTKTGAVHYVDEPPTHLDRLVAEQG